MATRFTYSRLLTILIIVSFLFCPSNVLCQIRFERVTNLTAAFNTTKSKLKITWESVSGAKKYRLIIKDSNGTTLSSAVTSRTKRQISGSLFSDERKYKILVKVLKTSDLAASKNKKLTYTHSTSSGSAERGVLTTKNSAGRTGSYYLPKNFKNSELPIMVAFHGTGGSGEDMVSMFADLANEFSFIIIAPDSRKSPSGSYTWEVGSTPSEITEDYTHTLNCIKEVLSRSGVTKDDRYYLAVGYSGGGSSAPYLATNESRFTNFAILHGGVFTSNLGTNVIPGWLSTGKNDTLRPPSELNSYQSALNATGFGDISFTQYSGSHDVSDNEKQDLVRWWLGK